MATHTELDGHRTPLSRHDLAPLGFGVVCRAQLVPFHRSASVTTTPALFVNDPTPVHAGLDVQFTAARPPFGTCGAGADSRLQDAALAAAGETAHSAATSQTARSATADVDHTEPAPCRQAGPPPSTPLP